MSDNLAIEIARHRQTQEKLDIAEAKLAAHKKMQPYIQHKEDCELRVVHHAFEPTCDCGLTALLNGDKP